MTASPGRQLAIFIGKFDAKIGTIARQARAKLRRQMPFAVEMIYDNYNALVIGFGPTDRASEAIVSLALFPRWVNLCFLQGVKLPDPDRLLRGNGKQVRNIVLEGANDLDKPAVRTLIAEAVRISEAPFPSRGRGRTVIKSISAAQRARVPQHKTSVVAGARKKPSDGQSQQTARTHPR